MGSDLPQWLSVALQFAEILGALVGAAGGVLWFLARQSMVTKEELSKREAEHDKVHQRITDRFDRGETRFNALTQSISNLPVRADLEKLKDKLDASDHSVSSLAGKIGSLEKMLERIEKPLDILVEQKMRGAP